MKKLFEKEKAARELFRATYNYYGFKNLETAPRGLKKLCYYFGEAGGETSDSAMLRLTRAKSRSQYLIQLDSFMEFIENTYRFGGIFSSYADYLCCKNYLTKMLSSVEEHPFVWWVTFHLHL